MSPGDFIPRPDLGSSYVEVAAPDTCPNGHPLSAGTVLVGWLPCLCADDEQCGHFEWICRTCHVVIYAPPHDEVYEHWPNSRRVRPEDVHRAEPEESEPGSG